MSSSTINKPTKFKIRINIIFITLILVCLKIFNVISWPWIIVLLPLWGGIVLFFGILVSILIIGMFR